MTRGLWIIGLLAAGCLSPRAFPCNTSVDCGREGRCEPEGVCSFKDETCESDWRYGEHAGSLAGTCTLPQPSRPLRNACVAGEPPPTADVPCAEVVCAALPSCCEAMWSEACVRLADQRCGGVHCGKWLAAAGATESVVLAWTGADHAIRGTTGAADRLGWIDARDGRPRLASAPQRGLFVDVLGGPDDALTFDRPISYATPNAVRALTGVDADGDRVVELGVVTSGAANPRQLVLSQTAPDATVLAALPNNLDGEAMAWADYTGDGIPDVAVGLAVGYRLVFWSPTSSQYELAFTGMAADAGPFPSVDWGDVDGDRRLDLVAIGGAILVHRGVSGAIPAQPTATARTPSNAISTGAVGDVDGDGLADVVAAIVAGEPVGGQLRILYGYDPTAMPNQRFSEYAVPSARMVRVTLADVDDDDRLDVLGAVEGGGLVWYRNLSQPGAPALGPATPIAAAAAATWVTATGWPAP